VFDLRIAKSVDSNGEGASAAVVTRFVYDGDHVWADYNSSGVVLARYLYGDRTDELLARYQPVNGTAWYLTDNLGTVRDLVDESGDLLNHIDYDSFGQITAQSNATAGDRFTYTGREFDSEIDLYYYRARFYDPALGRFINQDPLGFDAGDPNLYRYVFNTPLMMTDPTGQIGIVEYVMNLGSRLKNAMPEILNCVVGELVGWAVGGLISEALGNTDFDVHGTISLGIGVTSCAFLGVAAHAQLAFLVIAESLHMAYMLHTNQATGLDAAIMLMQHYVGFKAGRGLSEHSAEVRTFLRDESGTLRIPIPGSPKRTTWPSTAEEMDEFLGMPGNKIPDGPDTPGRDKTTWRPNADTKITFERHPYHPNAPDWHRDYHWHMDTPNNPHQRFLPGDDLPGL